jgi:hypothetical protein
MQLSNCDLIASRVEGLCLFFRRIALKLLTITCFFPKINRAVPQNNCLSTFFVFFLRIINNINASGNRSIVYLI